VGQHYVQLASGSLIIVHICCSMMAFNDASSTFARHSSNSSLLANTLKMSGIKIAAYQFLKTSLETLPRPLK